MARRADRSRRGRSPATATSATTSGTRAGSVTRSWIILAILIGLYLLWTLIVYFLEPGLR